MDKIRSSAAAAGSVDMTALLGAYTNDVVCRAVSGNGSFREGRRNEMFREVIEGNAAKFGGFDLQDYFPSLGKLDLLAWVVFAKTNRLRRRWDQLLDKIIDDHETKSSLLIQHGLDDAVEEDQERDFVDVLLGLRQEYSLSRQDIKAILMDMFVAGTDTSYIVLEFVMAELMSKPHLMAKLQSEVRDKTPPKNDEQMVTEDDLGAMAYLQAVVKETLRLHPPFPLLLPHLSMAECIIDGYTIPAETRVIISAWALGRDAASWKDAGEFVPERFMLDGGGAPDFKGRDFQFLPFGAGRRICPGINFGMATVEIMLANLVCYFDWELPSGMRPEDVDMTDLFGLSMRRKEKLLLVPVSPHVSRA